MSNDKQGIDLIIDRMESLRLLIDSAKSALKSSSTTDEVDAYIESSFEHWRGLCVEVKSEATKLQRTFDAITGILALPSNETPENIALAVKICVERCQALEQKLIDFQDSHIK